MEKAAVPLDNQGRALDRRRGRRLRKLPSPEELRARQNQQLIDELRNGTLQWVDSENWGLPQGTVVLVPSRIAKKHRDLLLSYLSVGAGPAGPVQTKGLWQATLRLMDSRALERLPETLRQEFGAPLLLPDITRFYLKVKELTTRSADGLRKSPELISTVRRHLQRAHSDGERLLWQSLLENLAEPSNEAAPVAARCRFCEEVFTPPERSNARTDVCRKPGCRRRADAERKRQEYRTRVNPAEETRRLAEVGAQAQSPGSRLSRRPR